MNWLTTPPPRRPPPPKHPLFTRKFFSTKSFGPGHLVGAGILVLGLAGITKIFIGRSREQADQARRSARPPLRPEDAAKLAQVDNGRGEYGRAP